MLELWFSNQDGSNGFEWPSGAVSDRVLGITSSLLLLEAQPTLALPTSTAHSLPTSSTGLGYCQRKPFSCWGSPSTHLFWEKCLPSDLVPAQSLGLIARTRCTNE